MDRPKAIISLEMTSMKKKIPLLRGMISQVMSSSHVGNLSGVGLSNVSPKEKRLQST